MNPLPRLRHLSITTKLGTIVAIFLFAIVAITAVVAVAFNVQSGVRAYVTGEGLWSKGQKDAVYAINRYLRTRDEADYRSFERGIAVPLGDHRARIELSKLEYEHETAVRAFIDGGNAPADVPDMIFVFRNFSSVSFFAEAVRVWHAADVEVAQLLATSADLRAEIAAGPLAAEREREFLDRIDDINARVTPLELRFSQTLVDGARVVQQRLLTMILLCSELLVVGGLLVSWLIARDLRRSVSGLREGAIRVAQGDLGHRIEVRTRDELGELATVFNNMVARRHEAEVALTTATEFRERVMESATNAIYTMDLEGRFATANQRTCEITGYPLDELIGLPWASIVPAELLSDLFDRYAAAIHGIAPILNYEVPLIQKGGAVVTITFSVAALSREGVIFGVVGTAEDITERKRAEVELAARADELVRSNRELEQFAYVASHDLQEPLRTVSGFAQLLARRYQGKLGEDADEYIRYVTEGSMRMKSLIEDLLAYSRVSREPNALKNVDLKGALAAALANLRGAIDAAGGSVISEPLPTLRANERQMIQLFQNLIGNALKFRRDAAPVVHISAEHRPGEWQLTVRDNGIGIEPKHAEQVFGLFQRLHGRDKYAGNGIGLTICKKIVDLHRGRIWVEPGASGAVFRFTLAAADES